MSYQRTVEQSLKLVDKILVMVDVRLKNIKPKRSDKHHINSARKEIQKALTALDDSDLQAFIEYQTTLESLLERDEDWSSYPDLLNNE